ncbi:M20 family metallopeptidase [Nocardia gipuzkoensis]|uniref:M20 family metallopeptidase n=1 Tax=Nocardia gipuzkoensis TaxID=2749991 RepID=UPI00237E282E|nr:M20/M25/M40 family metallo-hydrolase [Nocardia gipuzkoensis]MDE1674748.1 M20/M25/M40 family metallo-hydrolase [Nocardia gipuzkoensis]
MTLDVVGLCRQLIGIDTQNPPGRERAVGECLAETLVGHRFDIQWHGPDSDRANMLATLDRGAGPQVILQAHADTKPAVAAGAADRWTVDPFAGHISDGRLYGLGACDTKGGMAAFVTAACALAADPGWRGQLVVQCVADEEDGSALGAAYLLDAGLLNADAALVAEPTSCLPSLAQLGLAWAEITITGRAAHAGTPSEGIDAYRAATRYITVLDELVAELDRDGEFPGHPRVNVGYLQIPGHPGTMPGECLLRCDIRVLPGIERDDIYQLYQRAADTIAGDGVTVSVTRYQGGGCRSHRIAADSPLAAAFRAAQTATRQPPATLPFLGGSDARFFGAAATPALVYGPGSLRHAHAPDEYVPVTELDLAHRQVTLTLRQLLYSSSRPPM